MTSGVSVIIPTYNNARYLERCIQSVLNQTRAVDEIIVIDDASTDDTEAVIKACQAKAGNLVYIKRSFNSGNAGIARNQGVLAASQQIIAFLDSDDTWEPWHIEETLEAFELFPEAGLVFARYELVDPLSLTPDIEKKYKRRDFVKLYPEIIEAKAKDRFFLLEPHRTLHYMLRNDIGIHFSSVVLDRSRLKHSLHHDPLIALMEDLDFLMQHLFSRIKPAYIDSVHTAYYIHGSNTTLSEPRDTSKEAERRIQVSLALRKRLIYCRSYQDHRIALRNLSNSYWLIAIQLDSAGDFDAANIYYLLSFRTRPTFTTFKHIAIHRILGNRGRLFFLNVANAFRGFREKIFRGQQATPA